VSPPVSHSRAKSEAADRRALAPWADRAVLGNTGKALGPMLDTRGHGGQVLAPGSRLPNGAYELLDDTDPAPRYT